MKKIFIFILTIACFSSQAQQETQFTQFMYNKLLVNPAFAGAREVTSASAIYRQQWAGFEGAPVSQVLSFDTPFSGKKLGFGLNLHHYTIGQVNNNFLANMDYSYSLWRTQNSNFKLGIGATFRSYNFQLDKLSTGNNVLDLAQLTGADQKFINGNVGLGLYYTYKDFYIGFSVPNLYRNKLGTQTGNIIAQNVPHFYGMLGGLFPMTDNVDLKPALIVKYAQNTPFSVDANLSFVFNKKFNIGASYRTGQSGTGESLDALVFFQATEKLGFGFAYDYGFSSLAKYNKGSYEMLMRYDFTTMSKKEIITNPRFFF